MSHLNTGGAPEDPPALAARDLADLLDVGRREVLERPAEHAAQLVARQAELLGETDEVGQVLRDLVGDDGEAVGKLHGGGVVKTKV